ncbi:hypothetical protein F5144DRAFT_589217 [Chaetomium tenue]|uniref:Uncharacterized protein n=1 Tax=Chaetomium tenue TaxID=1854479 RepID=A0ACB7PPP5_9PEZI|nr:hypothetical protein F5144DRAFT_589217 [Chaetomium globosum]
MNALERQDLQLLLEKDLGHAWWYCHCCSLLLPISTQGPTGGTRDSLSWVAGWDFNRPYHNRRWLEGSSFSVDYQSVRLVMNRHFLGPLKERWSARIVQGRAISLSYPDPKWRRLD